MEYRGKLFRALNPVYARDPFSGRGAKLYGGRFNPKGVEALYTATSVLTAIREANQAGDLQPTTIVSYNANIARVFDTRDPAALAPFGVTQAGLADNGWRDQMRTDGKSSTQIFAEALIADGYHGLLVRSFVRGANEAEPNLVLWKWGASDLELIDDEGRLKSI
jgi:RES domain-containing protein